MEQGELKTSKMGSEEFVPRSAKKDWDQKENCMIPPVERDDWQAKIILFLRNDRDWVS